MIIHFLMILPFSVSCVSSNVLQDCSSLSWRGHCWAPAVREGRCVCGVWSLSGFCTSSHQHTQVWREEGWEDRGREGKREGGEGRMKIAVERVKQKNIKWERDGKQEGRVKRTE